MLYKPISMVHDLHSLTIGKYAQFEQTNNLNLLKKPYNILPIWLFKKKIFKFFTDFDKAFNNSGDRELNKDKLKLMTFNKIQILITLYQGVNVLLSTGYIVNTWLDLIGKKQRNIDKLESYCKEIFRITRIEIKTINDLKLLQEEIERRTLKYKENYKDNESKDITLTQLAIGVFSMLNMSYNENMSLYAFAQCKKRAEEIGNEREKQLKKWQK